MILSDIEQRIKAKIEAIGTPLKDWDISINYGIKTGFNDAFIIDGEKRAELIAQDPKSEEIIRPILRGRDIKRYGYEWNDKYVIIARLESDIPNKYPAICKHLEQFKGKGKLGDNSTTKVFKRPWWAWMQEPVSYWEDFSKQKIVYSDISERLNFQIIENEIYFNNTIYFITSQTEDLTYLLKFLSSNLIDWYYKSLSVQLGEKAIRMFTIYVLNIPIPKKGNRDNIYESYQLTEEEEEFIESLYYN
ncbi:TaqI-like C-terminal specificity domain-containing protein [Capnocytophaga leadbetteri]|uniref:TaqI-like C-terminal specificity domain-containing protein n=1 Tax=Capnocytophaga leadbetteri TaxID=327575 RepID=UPI0026EFCCC6|nr:TaqI-like C-terminal specificity domain-containing protein [Capnocytophaga leadbetteri]